MTKTGLYLGKFAPPHKGHQYVIETALKEVDELYLIIYDEPETTDIPLTLREKWLQDLYPSVKTIQAWNGPKERGYTKEIKQEHEQYVDKLLPNNINITHFYSSEDYGKHMSESLNAIDRRIDPDRNTVPISGTKVRNDPYKNREYVDNKIYSELITKITFVGAPLTGKTTLSKELASEYETNCVIDEAWDEELSKSLSPKKIEKLIQKHRNKVDEKTRKSNHYIFSDTNPITLEAISKHYNNNISETLRESSKKSKDYYDIHVVCDVDVPYSETKKYFEKNEIKKIQKNILSLLEQYKTPYYIVSGDLTKRIQEVKNIIEKENKWRNRKNL